MPSLPLHHTRGSADTLSLHSYYSGFILSYTLGPRAKQPAAIYEAAQRRHFEQPSLFTTLLFFSLRCSKTLLCFTQIQPVICSTLPHLSPLEMHQTSVSHLLLEVRSEKEERELSCQHEVTVCYISWVIHPWLPLKAEAHMGDPSPSPLGGAPWERWKVRECYWERPSFKCEDSKSLQP